MTRRAVLLFFLIAGSASAQLPQISLTGVFPPGGQVGETLNLALTGADLDEVDRLIFSVPGITAVPRKDANGKQMPNQFAVTVDSKVAPGVYDVRAVGLFGVSNPRIFRVDSLPEVTEAEPNNSPDQTQTVTINQIVNARSNGRSDVDRFRFEIDAGQTVVVRSEAATLGSMMQPVLSLYDAAGKRVAHSRRQRKHDAVLSYHSPSKQMLEVQVNDVVFAGGNGYEYRLSVDTRPLVEFVYPPVIPAGKPSKVAMFGVNLPNAEPVNVGEQSSAMEKSLWDVTLPESTPIGTGPVPGGIPIRQFAGVPGNLLKFAEADLPAVEEQADEEVQTITLPAAVCGGFETRNDTDTYRFDAKKGQAWSIDVLADRLGSLADPILIVEQVNRNEAGEESLKRLARVESGHANPGGNELPASSRDPFWTLTAPADGIYQIRLRDRYASSRGAAKIRYCALISAPPTPSFRVVLFDSRPSVDGKTPTGSGAVSLRRGGTYQIPMYVFRTGGHKDAIALVATNLPRGISLSSAQILPGQSSGVVVLNAAEDVQIETHELNLIAVSGPTLPDQITTDSVKSLKQGDIEIAALAHGGVNGLSRDGRTAAKLVVSVMRDAEPVELVHSVASADLSQDQQLLIPMKLNRRAGFVEKVDLQFSGLPKNVDVPKITFAKGTDSATVRIYVKDNVAPGNSVLNIYGTATVPYRRKPWEVDEAKAKTADAEKRLADAKAQASKANAAVAAAQKKLTDANEKLVTSQKQLKDLQAARDLASSKLAELIRQPGSTSADVSKLEVQLTSLSQVNSEDIDAAIAALSEASKQSTVVSGEVEKLASEVNARFGKVQSATKALKSAQDGLSSVQKLIQDQTANVEKAKADVVAAMNGIKAVEKQKQAAVAAVAAAEKAAKPQNKNVRVVAMPVVLKIHTTPGKITAAVPGGGAVKKGASVEVPVTLARKNKFTGPVSVALICANGESRMTSDTVVIPADQTTAKLKISAAPDAAPGDLQHCVIRATAEFNGRKAAFDAPVSLKVVE